MRVLQTSWTDAEPDVREVMVALLDESIARGDTIDLGDALYTVETAYRDHGLQTELDKREEAWELTVRSSAPTDGGGATARKPWRPPTLSAGAEALPPDDRRDDSPA